MDALRLEANQEDGLVAEGHEPLDSMRLESEAELR